MTSKPGYKSRTFWLNLAAVVVASALEEPNPSTMAQVLGVANIVLRFFTSEPIGNA